MKVSYPKEKIKILLLENISNEAVAMFQDCGYVQIEAHKASMSEEELIQAIKDVHIIGIRSKTHITARVLQAASKLLAIGCYCIGTNQVDKIAASQLGIAVFNAPYSNTRSVAELVIGAAIMLIRRIPEKNKAAHDGIWLKDATNSRELRGKTLGIIGYGNIGSQVSVLAEAMGMHIVYYDVVKKLPLGNAISLPTLEDIFRQADIITIHIPANKQTSNIIDSKFFSLSKKGALFINYARGEVVDIAALAESIQKGILQGAAIDVFPEEPEKNGADFKVVLQGMTNVLLTPHIGGSTEEAQKNIGQDVTSKLISFIETGNSQGSHSIPQLSLPINESAHRILHIHKNEPGVLSKINSVFAKECINIVGQYLSTNDLVGYVVMDISNEVDKNVLNSIRNISETVKFRIIF